jgi:RNA polymerase sigma-70 factor (ECF subfamily)
MSVCGPGDADEPQDSLVLVMKAYQAGERPAFERLYEALAPELRRHFDAVSRGGAAQDLVQETFLELHRARRTYLPPLPVRPWVFGIARNVLRRHRRAAQRRERIAQGISRAAASRKPVAARRLEANDVGEALHRVPRGRREAWELHHLHGLSFPEIARELSITVAAAKLRSSRAMGALRAALGLRGGRRRA